MAVVPVNNFLTFIETKVEALNTCSCLLSLNSMSLGLAVDVCRTTRYFELLLNSWQNCMPLGEASDVNFAMWGGKLWEMMRKVRTAYMMQHVDVSEYKYEMDSYLQFKESQQAVDVYDSSLEALHEVEGEDVPIILMCSMRALSEVLMQISEFLNTPSEDLLATSYEKWVDNYKLHYQKDCRMQYKKWRLQFTQRTLKKHLQERLKMELGSFKQAFFKNDDEFELVYDVEQKQIDIEGLSRFLFAHVERFGVSYIDPHPMLSNELVSLFNFVETLKLLQADLRPSEKAAQKKLGEKGCSENEMKEMCKKILTHTAGLKSLFGEDWDKWQQLCKKVCLETDLFDKLKKVNPRYNEWKINQKMVCNMIGLFLKELELNISVMVINKILCQKNIRVYISNHTNYGDSSTDLSREQHERIERMLV